MVDWHKLISLPDSDLTIFDIAEINLACAIDLSGSEKIDATKCLRTLDLWAETVRQWTTLSFHQFYLSNPADYNHSEAMFRAIGLITVLQKHCGLRYDPRKINLPPNSPFELDEEFVHGAIQGNGGTCATLPVVYAAVGRRLGYPIRLVKAKRHLFARWEDPTTGEKFNIEGSGQGMNAFPDDHYRN